MQRAGAREDQHRDHRLGPVGDARQRVEAQRGEAAEDPELMPVLAVLARTRAGGRDARPSRSRSRPPPAATAARWPAGTAARPAGYGCWSSATAAFIFWIAGIVSSALTLLIVCANAGPSAASTFFVDDRRDVLEPEHLLRVGQNRVLAGRQLGVGREHVRRPAPARVERLVREADRERHERRVDPVVLLQPDQPLCAGSRTPARRPASPICRAASGRRSS